MQRAGLCAIADVQVHCMNLCIDWPQESPWLTSQTVACWHSRADQIWHNLITCGIICAVMHDFCFDRDDISGAVKLCCGHHLCRKVVLCWLLMLNGQAKLTGTGNPRRQGAFAQTCRAGQASMTSILVTSEAVQML